MNRPKCKICKEKDAEIANYKENGEPLFRSVCWKCRSKSDPNYKENSKRYCNKIRKTVIEHYGNKCECCGEDTYQFLTVDHINNNGNKERKKFNGSRNILINIIRNNFPSGYRILCFNCNCGRQINGGTCPHKARPIV
jgi:hypothetical protein